MSFGLLFWLKIPGDTCVIVCEHYGRGGKTRHACQIKAELMTLYWGESAQQDIKDCNVKSATPATMNQDIC